MVLTNTICFCKKGKLPIAFMFFNKERAHLLTIELEFFFMKFEKFVVFLYFLKAIKIQDLLCEKTIETSNAILCQLKVVEVLLKSIGAALI